MTMEVDRLTVKVDTDFRGLTSGLKGAASQVQGFKKEVEGTQAQLGKGGDFPVRTDTRQVDTAQSKVGALFQEISKGGTFEVRADDSQLSGVSGLLATIRADVANSPTFTINADVDDSAATAKLSALEAKKAAAATDIHSNVDVDTAGATASLAAYEAEKAAAGTDVHSNVDVDTAGATTQLTAFQGLVSWFDGREINMPIDINTVSSIAGLFSVQAAVLSLGAQLLGLSVSSDIASGSLTGLGAVAASAAVGIASLGAAVVAVVTAVELVETGISALLGGLLTVGSAAALAATGFGLVAAAGYVLFQMVKDNTDGMGYLSDSLSQLKADFMTAFEPAAVALAPLAQQLIDLADSALPALGQQAAIATAAMSNGIYDVIATISSAPMMESDLALFFKNMPVVVESLTTAVGNFGAGLFSILAQASPAAAELAQWIQGIAESFFQWTQSEEGRAAIAKWLSDAAIILPAIKDAFVTIVGAFSDMEGFDAESLASGIRGVGDAIAAIIGFIGAVKQGWDAFDYAINATLDYIVSWVPEVNLLDKIMGDTGGLDASALIESLSSAWDTVTTWIAGLVPDITLMDVITGHGTLVGAAESGGLAAQLILALDAAWTAVSDWMAGLAPEITLMDVIMGNATMGEAVEEGGIAANIIASLGEAWTAVSDWISGLAPEITLMDVIMGSATMEEAAGSGNIAAQVIETLQGAWDSVMEWLGGLVPDISLVDIVLGVADVAAAVGEFMATLGESFASGFATVTQTVADFFASLYNDYWLYYFGLDGVLVTGVVDFFTSLYNDYWLYYFGADGVLVTGVSDFFTSLYNDYWLYYFGADGVLVTGITDFFTSLYNDWWLYYFGLDGLLITGITDFFTSLYNDWWLYYFGLDGLLITGITDFFTSLYNDWWLYYFGLDGVLITGITDFFTSLYNDWWLYYFGLDGTLITGISDFFTSLYNDYWLYYFGLDGALIGPIVDFFTSLYNDYFLYYLGPDGVVVTAVADAWDAILTAIPEFVRSFGNLLGNGLAAGINAGIGYLQGLLDAIDAVLTAINVSPLGVTLPTVEFQEFGSGGSTESMAAGGSRGGAGSRGKQPRHIVWNEGMGEEYWIATGPAADKRKNVGWLAKAAGALGLGVVPMQAGGVVGSGGRLSAMSRTLQRLQPPYLAREFPDETTATSRASTASTASGATAATRGTLGEKKLTRRQKRRARRRERRQGTTATTTGLTGTTPTTTPTTPISGTTGTTPVTGTPSSTAGMAAPAGVTRSPTLTGGSGTGRRSGAMRGRLGARKRGGARFSNVHHRKRRGGGRHHRATGGPVFMAIGGGTDTGPAGLSGEAASIADEIMNMFGVWANTYVGGDTPHGSLHGNVPENTFDFWGDSGFSPLDIGTGDAILQYLYDHYGSDLDTVIWQGVGEGPGGGFADDDHFDHLHASVGGGGILGAAGVLAAALFNKIKGIWDSAMSALGSPDMGEGALWDGIETYLMTLPMMAWEWLKSKIPRGTGGFRAGAAVLTGGLSEMASQAIQAAGWASSELSALTDLWQNESGWDANAVNPDSGAYGIPQINPASWPDGPPVGDAAGQIAWGVDYIKERYGSPTAALDFWLANGWYATGGVVPGAPGTPQSAVVHGGERVLPRNLNRGFENLAKSVERWDGSEASGMGGTGTNNEAEAVLEDILVEIKRGNDNPTPVDINNMTDMQRSFVTGFMAGIDSDVTTEKLDQKMAEGVRFASTLGGL